MERKHKVTMTILGILGGFLYFKREIHQAYYVHIQGNSLESYDPEPIKGFL